VTDWTAFAGFAGVVVALFLLLARASQSMVSATGDSDRETTERPGAGVPPTPVGDRRPAPAEEALSAAGDDGPDSPPGAPTDEAPLASYGTGALLANVLATQGLFAGLVAAGVVYWQVPAAALGVGAPSAATVGGGVGAGVALYVGNEAGAAALQRAGLAHEETLRELLAPEGPRDWLLLLGGVLPVVAVAEELVFRGVLVGVLATGFGLPPWGLAVASSVVFGLGHGAQGRGGVLVTGLLGFALAAAFVVSGSLALVVVAHYVVNALEFVVHEGLGVEWA
jgi:membrane protease YdiL (CAAX protease family)